MALDLVSPLVPNAQENKGPEIFTHALGQGLAAVARLTQQRRDSEIEMLKLAEHERVSQELNALEKEKMANDYEIRQGALQATIELNSEHAKYFKAGTEAYKSGTKTALQRATARQEQEQALATEISDHARELKLDDPNFATKEPVRFAANVMQFKDAWEMSPLPWVKSAIGKYQATADQQKITLKSLDENGKPTGDGKPLPIWQIVKNLQDPETKDQMARQLRANGQLKEETVVTEKGKATRDWSRPFDSFWDATFGPTDKTKTVDAPSTPEMDRILKSGKGVEFKRVPSRVPPAAAPRSAYDTLPPLDGTDPMPDGFAQPQASAQPKFEETETDRLIRLAKAARARNPGAVKVIADRLRESGIDPQVLEE